MNKWISLVLGIAIVAIGAVFAFKILQQPKEVESLESLVPGDALYYFYSYNPNKKISDIKNSQFSQKILSLSAYKKHIAPELAKLKEKAFVFQNIFSRDSAMALFNLGNVVDKKENFGAINFEFKDFLLLAILDLKNVKSTLKDLQEIAFKGETPKFKKYKGIRIIEYSTKGEKEDQVSTYFTLLGNVLVSSDDYDLISKSIDLFKEDSQDSLLSNEIFKKVTGNYNQGKEDVLLWTYFNYEKYYKNFLAALAKAELEEGDFSVKKGISFAKFRDVLKRFTDSSMGVFSSVDYAPLKQGLILKSYQFFDKSKDKTNFLDILSSSATASEITGVVPSDSLLYYSLSGDATKYWNYLKSFLSNVDELESTQKESGQNYSSPNVFMVLSFVESLLGGNLERDILPLLGTSSAVILSDFKEVMIEPFSGGLPEAKKPFIMPEFSIIIQAKDKAGAKQLRSIVTDTVIPKVNELLKLQAAFANESPVVTKKENAFPGENQATEESSQIPAESVEDILQLEVQSYQGHDIYELSIKGFPILPICFVLDDYLVISTSSKFAEKTIFIQKGFNDSLDSRIGKEAISDLTLSDCSQIYYVDPAALISKITETKMFMAAKPFAVSASQGKVTGDDIDSLIDIFSDISLIINTFKLSDQSIAESSMYIKIEGLQ